MSGKYEPTPIAVDVTALDDLQEAVISIYWFLVKRVTEYGDAGKVEFTLYLPYAEDGWVYADYCGLVKVVDFEAADRIVWSALWKEGTFHGMLPEGYAGYLLNASEEALRKLANVYKDLVCVPPDVNKAVQLLDRTLRFVSSTSDKEAIYRYGPAQVVINDYNLADSVIKSCMLEVEKTLFSLEHPVFDGKYLTKGERIQVLGEIYILLEQLLAIPEAIRLLP